MLIMNGTTWLEFKFFSPDTWQEKGDVRNVHSSHTHSCRTETLLS